MSLPAAIRDAGPGDREALFTMFRELQAFELALEANRLAPEACGPHLDALLAWAADRGCVLIAEAPDAPAPVGLLIAGLEDEGAYVLPENRPQGRISDLWVAPSMRRQGLATALLDAAADRLRARGLRRVTIGALEGNAPARRLYERWCAGPPHAIEFARPL